MSLVMKSIATLGAVSLIATPALAAPALQTSPATRSALSAEMGGRIGSPTPQRERVGGEGLVGGGGGVFLALVAGAAIILGVVVIASNGSGRPNSP